MLPWKRNHFLLQDTSLHLHCYEAEYIGGARRKSNVLPASAVRGLWVNKWLSIRELKYLLTLIIIIRAPTEFYLGKNKNFECC